MPEGLTRGELSGTFKACSDDRLQIGTVAGFVSEGCPASNRNAGRVRVGIPGRNESESAPEQAANIAACSIADEKCTIWSARRQSSLSMKQSD